MPATVMIVDVGQGDCTVAVDSETKKALLVDCNAGYHEAAVAALEELDFSELSAAVVTHSHLDHFGGVLEVLEQLQERFTGVLYYNHDSLVAMPRYTDGSDDNKPKVRALLTRALEFGERVSRAQSDIPSQTLGTMIWTLLAPSYTQLLRAVVSGSPNLASGIVLIQSEGRNVVVGGDAQLEVWKAVQAELPSQSIVRWPHHGGKISNSSGGHRSLLRLLNPTAVLVSVGANNQHDHPSDDFFTAVAGHSSRLLCTQVTTKCTVGSPGGQCAGSIRIHLASGSEPQPTPSRPDHDAFVRMLGAARCLSGEQGQL